MKFVTDGSDNQIRRIGIAQHANSFVERFCCGLASIEYQLTGKVDNLRVVSEIGL